MTGLRGITEIDGDQFTRFLLKSRLSRFSNIKVCVPAESESRVMSIGRISFLTVFATLILFSHSLPAADAPSVELALTFKPIQTDIEIESPEKSEYGRCKVEVEQSKKSSGWIVYGPN
ncbi:MAG TPA: thioredoxin, partial [Planctomycetaceae bacterium]|nr:thioredoxin [Planctomycetaceae bacterium]